MQVSDFDATQNSPNPQQTRSRIPRVAIVGTGFVGSTTAYALLISGTATEIVLIDRDRRRAEGHVHDLRDAEVFSHTTRVVAGGICGCCSAAVGFFYTRGCATGGEAGAGTTPGGGGGRKKAGLVFVTAHPLRALLL